MMVALLLSARAPIGAAQSGAEIEAAQASVANDGLANADVLKKTCRGLRNGRSFDGSFRPARQQQKPPYPAPDLVLSELTFLGVFSSGGACFVHPPKVLIPIQPLIWCFPGLPCQGSSSPEERLPLRHRYV